MSRIKCPYYQEGYCVFSKFVEDQLESETQWECDGSEEEMNECGVISV